MMKIIEVLYTITAKTLETKIDSKSWKRKLFETTIMIKWIDDDFLLLWSRLWHGKSLLKGHIRTTLFINSGPWDRKCGL